MKLYKFRINWENSYSPISVESYYSQYAKLTPYEITISENSCKRAMRSARAYIEHKIADNPKKFDLIPVNE